MLNEMRLGKITDETVKAFRRLERPIKYKDALDATELWVFLPLVSNDLAPLHMHHYLDFLHAMKSKIPMHSRCVTLWEKNINFEQRTVELLRISHSATSCYQIAWPLHCLR